MKLSVSNPGPRAALVAFQQDHLDASNIKAFRAAMEPLLAANDHVLLDMGALTFVDSSGLGSLLSCLRQANNNGGELRLFGLTKPVMALFELVRMHRIFSIYESRELALEDVVQASKAA